MTETKWTPGPWEVRPCSNGGALVDRGVQSLQTVPVADAHLIAAAPELYEALADFEKEYRGGEYDDDLWPLMKKARAALAKARGET